MLPYSVWLLLTGVILTVGWFYLGIDLGPGAPIAFEMPAAPTVR
jgi:aminobenzoyl-glutamate transport protein